MIFLLQYYSTNFRKETAGNGANGDVLEKTPSWIMCCRPPVKLTFNAMTLSEWAALYFQKKLALKKKKQKKKYDLYSEYRAVPLFFY